MKVEEFPSARELALWLRALQSFFNQANQPFTDSERANISTRNFRCETQIVRDTLLRCLQLLGNVSRAAAAHGLREEEFDKTTNGGAPTDVDEELPGLAGAKDSLVE